MGKPSVTVEELRRSARKVLTAAESESVEIDCKILMCEAFGWDASDLIANAHQLVNRREHDIFAAMLARRLKHEPIAYIVEKQSFWSLNFKVTNDVLIPRPETEGVVERALRQMRAIKNPVIADIGTGSGAILVSLLHERKDATGIGLDISSKALEVAKLNADQLGVAERATFEVSDYLSALDRPVDIVVSNPPYITDKAMGELPNTVAKYEPALALRGDKDGLAAYKAIIRDLARVLKRNGIIVFEIGFDQGQAVASLLKQHEFKNINVDKDLAGHDRVVSGKVSA